MRRVSVLPLLALVLSPGVAVAQTAPSGTAAPSQPETQPATEPGSETTTAPAGATNDQSGSTAAAALSPVETTPALPPAAGDQVRAAATGVTPTPVPELLESRSVPILDVHGYLRTRYELFYNYGLGWEAVPAPGGGTPSTAEYRNSGLPWNRPPDYMASVCTGDPMTAPIVSREGSCNNSVQTSANLRLRLNPELHPTDFITIHSQIDLLDNLVMGSTPEGYYVHDARSPWAPITAFSQTQIQPTYGYNGYVDSIAVKRAWAEVTNQSLGQIRFGRMPSHWGLGMIANAGNGYDSDYQSTVDRVMYAARIRPLGIFFAAMWDFPSTGATSQSRLNEPGMGQPYDVSILDDVHQWVIAAGRRMEPDAQRAALAQGKLVINGGVYFVYRQQYLSGEAQGGTASSQANIEACEFTGTCGASWVRRDALAAIPDVWLQVLGQDFRVELEAAFIIGQIRNIDIGANTNDRYTINQFGAVLEAEYRLLSNRLKLFFNAGYSSGDPDIEGLNYQNGLRPQFRGDRNLSLFRFHPDYRIDLIYWRAIQKQIAGAYFFRPAIQYSFIDEPGGDLLFGRVDAVWSRASEFVATRGNHADLGIELDATVQYQSNHRRADGSDPRPAPGFYANIQYGAFFPLAGVGPTDAERLPGARLSGFQSSIAMTLRAYLGVMF